MKFAKFQATGNDFIIINCFEEGLFRSPYLAKRLCDRHFGIGADGLILLLPSRIADFRVQIFNPDGTQAEISGNGLRCAAKYAYQRGIIHKRIITIQTLAGVKVVKLLAHAGKVYLVKVNMGRPMLVTKRILKDATSRRFIEQRVLHLLGRRFKIQVVNIGNPHCVIFVPSVERFQLEELGPLIEKNPIFPESTNVQIAEILNKHTVKQRTWERGVGETLACGSGVCATISVLHQKKLAGPKVEFLLKGGKILAEYLEDGIWISAGAEKVFDGEISWR